MGLRFGVLGTGVVGKTIAAGLAHLGDEVMLGTFAEAAAPGETVFTATPGAVSLGALELAGVENLSGKVLIDVSNPRTSRRARPPPLGFQHRIAGRADPVGGQGDQEGARQVAAQGQGTARRPRRRPLGPADYLQPHSLSRNSSFAASRHSSTSWRALRALLRPSDTAFIITFMLWVRQQLA
jgi:hypothetical protein